MAGLGPRLLRYLPQDDAARERLFLAALATAGLLVGWLGTAPGVAFGINWDTASYLAKYASGQEGWSGPPWTSHYALGQAYLLGAWAVRPFGGTFIDGARLCGALALAASAALVGATSRALGASRSLAALAAAVFLSAWGTLLLVFTFEDNLLFMPAGAAALAIAVRRHDGWRLGDGLAAGALVGAGTLLSWQAVVYLFPPIYVALIFGGAGRGPARRARDAAVIIAALFALRVAWALFYAATAPTESARSLLAALFARPEPSFFPRGIAGWFELAQRWRTVLRHLGLGILHETGPPAIDSVALRRAAFSIGAGVLAVMSAAAAATAWWARRHGRRGAHLVAASLLALMIAAALYVDLPVDKFKRYDHLPLLLPLLGVALLAPGRKGALAAFAIVLVVQVGSTVAWNRNFHRALPASSPPGYHGHDGQTWFAHTRFVRRQSPRACRYVFTLDELAHGRFQLEIPAALWSELPGAVVIGDPAAIKDWPRPLPVEPLAPTGLRGCEWLSAGARRKLATFP